jgi:serine/threonine protein kinase
LGDAHALGIVHRDIKPSNLFLTHRADGEPLIKLLDFGISKSNTEDGNKLTATNAAMGTPCYMSPEQIRNASSVDSRTDVWALGVTLFELLTDDLPFRGETAFALCAAVTSDVPIGVRTLRDDVPVELEAIISRCLEKKPENRFQSFAALAKALIPFGPPAPAPSIARMVRMAESQEAPASAGPKVSLSVDRAVSSDSPTVSAIDATSRASMPHSEVLADTVLAVGSRSRLVAAIGIAAGAIALGTIGYFSLRTDPPRPSAASAAPIVQSESGAPAAPTGAIGAARAEPAASVAQTDPIVSQSSATPKPQPVGAPPTAKHSDVSAAVPPAASVPSATKPTNPLRDRE